MVTPGRRSWRIDKAERFLSAAEAALAVDDAETAVSRAYYAVYHAVIALLEARAGVRRRRWDHDTVRNDFLEHFARRGFRFTMRDAEGIRKLYENRLEADYEDAVFKTENTQSLLEEARRLVAKISEVIRDA